MTREVYRRVHPDRLGVTLACSTCHEPLRNMLRTAYGVRAACRCPDVRWTAIIEDPAAVPLWVAEKR